MMSINRITIRIFAMMMVFFAIAITHAHAQTSSLLHDAPPLVRAMQPMFPYSPQQDATTGVEPIPSQVSGGEPRVMLNGASWTYQPAPPVRVFRTNDIVTIRVDEVTRLLAQAGAESRKQTLFESVLSDWISLSEFNLRPDTQSAGDPTIAGQSNSRFRSEASVDSREAMSFNIAAMIVDIRPNGSLVLEARKNIRVNDNLWETALTGICRPEDIAPDNVVLSKDMIDLEILKEDRGHLRDGYKRGWFSRWFDRVQPF
jgi:flagellar L-ring protein FlgH